MRGFFGPPGVEGTTQEVSHLNRKITWNAQGITWEADDRHAKLLLEQLFLESKGAKITTPLVRERWNHWGDEQEAGEAKLDEEHKTRFQSLTMRLGYLSQDRPDLQRTVRELAKGMVSPEQRHWQLLKKAVRYLRSVPKVIQRITPSEHLNGLEVFVDSDHAGDNKTRKSTTGVVIGLDQNHLRTLFRGQAVISSFERRSGVLRSHFCSVGNTRRTIPHARLGTQD